MNYFANFFHSRKTNVLLLGSFFIFGLTLSGFSQGIDTPAPMGAFLNGVFPSVTPSQGSGEVTYTTANAFPNLTFVDPVKLLEMPNQQFMVVGKSGQVWIFNGQSSTSVKTLILDIKDQVVIGGDGGMVGGVLHPEFGQVGSPNRGYFYLVYRYTPAKGTNGSFGYWRLSRFTLEDGATQVNPNSEYVLIQQFDRHDWHNGGDMFFGPNGFLHVIGGDEGEANDYFNVTQQIDKWLFGGIFRLDVDKRGGNISHPIRRQPQNQATPPSGWPSSFTQGYYIPNDNPWQDSNGGILEEFYALGTRSPHRMTYDAVLDEIWVGDIGQQSREEISVVYKGDNLQWPYKEGTLNGVKPRPTHVIGNERPPVYEYGRGVGRAVIGGYVYRGSLFPELQGKYLFGDHETQNVWSLVRNNGQAPTVEFLVNLPVEGYGGKDGLSTFGEDAAGNIYMADLFGTDLDGGKIRKLVQTGNIPDPPQKLSDLNVFANLSTLEPNSGIVPYTVNTPLWSDRAVKSRWIALPNDGTHNTPSEQIVFDSEENWEFPEGTVLIKHFELPIDERNPSITRKLETRFFVFTTVGDAYGLTYRWNEAGTEAFLLTDGATDDIAVIRANGTSYIQTWTYPSRQQCMDCHNSNAGFALGVKTRQINGNFTYPGSGLTENQLSTWNHLGMFTEDIGSPAEHPHSVNLNAPGTSVEYQARSYIDANCSYCHQPNGVNGVFDGRARSPLYHQDMIETRVISNASTPGNVVIKPGSPALSELWIRDESTGNIAMPPVGKSLVHNEYIQTLNTWINSINTSEPARPENGWYTLEARHSGKIAGISNGSEADNAPIVQETDTDLPAQKWLFQHVGEGLYRISAQHSFKALSYTEMRSTQGANVTHESWKGAQDQTWYVFATNGGYYQVVNAYNGLFLDVFNGGLEEGANLILWEENDGQNQEWKLVPTSGPSTATDLLAHWSFDGGSLNDFAGLVPDNASMEGQIETNLPGISGEAVRIDRNGYLRVPHSEDLLLGGSTYPDFSVAFWLKIEQHNGPWMNLFTKGNENPRTPGIWVNHTTGGIHYRISTTSGFNQGGNSNTDLREKLNEWVHVTYVKEGSQLRLYMDGDLDHTPVNFPGTVLTSEGIPLTIGDFENGGDEGIFWMDELMVFGKALNDSEILELSQPEFPPIANCEPLDFNSLTISSHGGSQDAGVAEVLDSGKTLKVSNNGWKSIPFSATLSANSLLEFEFNSDITGEYHAIGLSSTNAWEASRSIKIFGTQDVGNDIEASDSYAGSGYQHYVIPVGQYYTGEVDRIFFLADHDAAPANGTSYFRNVRVYNEGDCPSIDPNPCSASGLITMERWNNIGGSWNISDIPVFSEPTATSELNIFEIPANAFDEYGVRVRGYICAPQTGEYTFWLASDDNGELWLSTDENPGNKVLISQVPVWTASREWTKYPEQKSASISLEAGKTYYIEALMKEGAGGDNLAVGWQLPNGTLERPVPGRYLSPFLSTDTTPPSIPENLSVSQITSDGAILDWDPATDDGNFVGYYVYQNGDPDPIASITDGSTTLSLSGLGESSTHQFAVAAFDAEGNLSAQSQAIQITTEAACPKIALYQTDFEEGAGIWEIEPTSGPFTPGSFLGSGGNWATSGTRFLVLQGDSEKSRATTRSLDLSTYTEVKFGFTARFLEHGREGDGVSLQVSTDGGATFRMVREWSFGAGDLEIVSPLTSNRLYGDVLITDNFTDQTQFRLQINMLGSRGYITGRFDDVSIEVCQLDNCTSESNLASNRSARLSSQYGNGSGDLGTDGNYVGSSPWSADLVHTTNEAQPWWEVDLGARSQVDSLVIYNRTNGNQGRLKNFYILTSDAPMSGSLAELLVQSGVNSVYFAYKADSIERIPVNAEGRYVRIQLSGNDILHFAEVEVIGCNLEQLCEPPVVSIDPVSPLNEDGSPVQLSASPSGGVWSGAVDGSGVFDPSVGVGTYEVIYSYEAFAGCAGSDTLEIEVLPSGSVCDAPANLASNGTASQSSTYGNGVAGLAIDGNSTGSNAWSADLQHTTREAQPWWQIDLGQQSKLNEIVLYNRSDNSFNRLKAFYILVSDVPMSASSSLDELLASSSVSQVYFPGVAGIVESIALDGLSGRYVRIQLSGSNILHMAEVEIMGCREDGGCIDPIVSIDPAGPFAADAGPQQLVASPAGGTWSGAVSSTGIFDPSQGIGSYEILYTYTDPNGCSASAVSTVEVIPGGCDATVNLALNKLTEQSSTYGNGSSSIAVDGNSLGTSPWSADLAHTNNEAQPWWQVDLGAISNIQQVKIYNRTDCCQGRLKNFHILTSTEPFSSTASLDELLSDPSVEDYFVAGAASVENTYNLIKEARYVRIQLSGSNILHIAEVEVLGCASENDPCFGEQAAQILGAEDQTIGFGSYQLTASPAGGSWSGDVTEAGLLLGTTCPGSYEAIYTYDNGQGCVSRDTATIVVKPEVMDVFIYAGQSNATGAQNTLDVLRVGDSPYDEKISYAWNIPGLASSNGWESLQAIEVDPATNRRGHGAEISFGRTLFEAGYNNIGIIKVARGGTNLANHWDPNTSLTGVSGNFGMYPEMLNTVNARLAELDAQGIPYRITGFLWHQGEGDMNPSMASIYGANLTELISALRSDFGQELKVFLASVYNPNATEEEGMLVRNAQRDVATADAQAYVVNLDTVYYDGDFNPNSENLIADNLHYNSIGQIKNGASFANTLLTFHPVEGCEDENTGACSSPENLALNQPTEQSSTYGIGFASLAVDGNRTGSSPWSADLQHTEVEEQPWWQVDLGAVSNIEQVNIYNRTDCCAGRLNNFYILVSDTPFDPTASLDELRNDPNNYVHTFTGRAGLLENITIGTTGRYVRIQHTRTIQLHLAEVEVMGCAIGTQGNRLANANEAEAGENIEFDLRVFPNPSSGRITISIDQLAQGEPVEYSLYNLQGQRVWQTRGQRTEQVNLSHLAKGVYLLKAEGANWTEAKQLIIN